MANPLSQFIQDRFIQPAVDAGVEKALSSKQPIAYGTSAVPELSLTRAIGQPHDADYTLLYALYKLNTDVSACVHKWAGGVTGPGWRITTMDPDAEVTIELEQQIQDIERWLKNPNPSKLFEVMLYETVEHFGISGDHFWFISKAKKDGLPLEIWPMHPALTRVVANKQGEILGYVMRAPGEEPIVFTTDEVLHFRLPNVTNDLYGEAPTELVLEEAGIDLSALRANKSIFQNGMNPSAIIFLEDGTTPEQAKQLTAQLKQAHTGADNQHKLIAVARAKDFKPSSLTNRDMEFLKLRDLATSKVTTAFRIPKVLLGHHNAGDYATTKFLIRETYAHVYEPIQRIIAEVVTERLIHLFNPELRFEFNKPDASDPDDIRKDQMQAKRDGILLVDEVRADSFGKDPLPEGEDEAHIKEEDDPDSDASDSPEDAPAAKSLVTKSVGLSASELELLDRRGAELDALAAGLTPSMLGFFDAQESGCLNRLQSLYPNEVVKSLDQFNLDGFLTRDSDAIDTTLGILLQALLFASLSAGVGAAQLQIGISLNFNRVNPIVQHYLDTRALSHAQGINTTTRTQLKVTLSEGITLGESIDQLAGRIRGVFSEAKGYRAGLIARNEINQAYAYANHGAMAESGVVLRRKWLTAGDDRVRPTHVALSGMIVDFNEPFPEGLEPGQEINCRCQEIGIVDEEAA